MICRAKAMSPDVNSNGSFGETTGIMIFKLYSVNLRISIMSIIIRKKTTEICSWITWQSKLRICLLSLLLYLLPKLHSLVEQVNQIQIRYILEIMVGLQAVIPD